MDLNNDMYTWKLDGLNPESQSEATNDMNVMVTIIQTSGMRSKSKLITPLG